MLFVDNGGFFPEEGDTHRDVAWFMMDAMKTLNIDAVNVGQRDLRYGLQFLVQRAKYDHLPMVSANLLDKKSRKPIFQPYLIKKVGNVKVGVLGLMSDKGDFGPGKDSLVVDDPLAVARKSVIDMRRQGAQIVVLLSQLGKVESEDLVSAVDGIDAVMVGQNAPVLQKGRMVKGTVACYGGDQGQYACRTEITLDTQQHMTTADAQAVMLGPEVGERAEIATLVKGFEDGFNEKLRKAEMERVANTKSQNAESKPDHFLGADLCIRCHSKEGDQWKTTSHSVAWQTLVVQRNETKSECIGCHVVGFNQPGGFTSASATPQFENVQCESCHGMGTQHDSFSTVKSQPGPQMCISCHKGEQDPNFNFSVAMPKVAHTNMSGETIQKKTVKTPADANKAPAGMKSG